MNRRRVVLLLAIGCGIRADESPQLENTYWKLIHFSNNAPIAWPPQEREPHLILHPHNSSASGATGCNRLIGSYKLRGKRLIFSKIAGTEVACTEGMETEKAFLEALSKTRRWKVSGQHLELLDTKNRSLAKLEVRYLR